MGMPADPEELQHPGAQTRDRVLGRIPKYLDPLPHRPPHLGSLAPTPQLPATGAGTLTDAPPLTPHNPGSSVSLLQMGKYRTSQVTVGHCRVSRVL